ncbi:RNAse P Rpr2/Rpp21/SNM1 subunit domain-containing protein [Chlamydoabsidia padenii]|nr:RNAse P Rpr2/Rpp21/SNM1 subunit domain-containing protein [Chlamydoabsidia padenii]
MATKQQAGRLDFLLQASNLMVLQNPALSRFYLSHYQETLRLHQLSAPKAIDRLGCPRCGQVYLAGLNTSVELVPKGSNHQDKNKNKLAQQKKNKKNTLVYTCHACQYGRKFNGSFKRYIPSTSTEIKDLSTGSTVDPTTKITQTKGTSTQNNSTPVNTLNKNNKNNADLQKATNIQQNSTNTMSKQQTNKRPAPSIPPLSKKKAKKNQLQSLLASRKEQKGGGGGGSIGLDDFLSSL